MSAQLEIVTLGGGCFWCLEAVFQKLTGVKRVVSGYAGGDLPNPTYQQVCSGTTGHAEVVQLAFDPAEISFAEILTVFWHIHNPTTLNRQGADIGTQYRSVIFYHDETQRATAEKSLRETKRSQLWPDPIVTEIAPLTAFYPAESYHQDYFRLNSNQGYCRLVIAPKVAKFEKEFEFMLQ